MPTETKRAVKTTKTERAIKQLGQASSNLWSETGRGLPHDLGRLIQQLANFTLSGPGYNNPYARRTVTLLRELADKIESRENRRPVPCKPLSPEG